MKIIGWIVTGIVALGLIGSVAGSGGEEMAKVAPKIDKAGQASAEAAEQVAKNDDPKPEPEPVVAPDPSGDYSIECDYLLGDFNEGPDGYSFIAGGDAINTGNVGIVAKLTVKWKQLGAEPIVADKTVRLAVGKTKNVNLEVLVGSNEIDRIQSVGYDQDMCTADMNIVDTFGQPQED